MSIILAQEFAELLDKNSYDEASQFLADECKYHYSEGNYQGAKNIINIYRRNHLESKKVFDEMTYSSVVEELPEGNFKINFTDKIRKGHNWHEFRSFQIVKFKENQVIDIQHCEILGEMESLRMFFDRARSQNTNLPKLSE